MKRFEVKSALIFFLLVSLSVSGWAESPLQIEKISKKRFRRSKLTNDESELTADKRSLLLTTGEDKAVDLDFEANAGANGISYGNPQIVTTTLVRIGDKRQLVFKPLKSGDTTVSVRDADGTLRLIFHVRVTGSNLLKGAQELRSLTRDIEGIEIRIVGSKIVADGEILVPSDYGRLLAVIQDKNYSDIVLNLTSLSPLAMQALAKRIQVDINNFASGVTTRVVNGMIFLEGSTNSIDEAKRAETLAYLYLPDLRPGSALERDPSVQRIPARKLIENFIVVNPPPQQRGPEKLVKLMVHFVELAKDYSKIFAFAWRPGFTADPQFAIGQSAAGGLGTTGTGTGTGFSATLSSLLPKLNASQSAGYARVLNTGTVIVRSGQPAKLTEQTTYPYTQTGANGQAVSAVANVGLSIAATPTILGQTDDIQLDVDLEQTDLVGSPPTGAGAAVTDSHKVSTKLYIKSNESAAVAGLDGSNVGTEFNKNDPNTGTTFAQNTDPLFNLMHSKSYRKKKTQFVIFLTPQIIESASEGTEDLRKNFRVKVR